MGRFNLLFLCASVKELLSAELRDLNLQPPQHRPHRPGLAGGRGILQASLHTKHLLISMVIKVGKKALKMKISKL